MTRKNHKKELKKYLCAIQVAEDLVLCDMKDELQKINKKLEKQITPENYKQELRDLCAMQATIGLVLCDIRENLQRTNKKLDAINATNRKLNKIEKKLTDIEELANEPFYP